MAHTICEMVWLKSLLYEMGIMIPTPQTIYCDNQTTIYIAINPVFHEHTKHIEVDCHFIRDLVVNKQMVTLRICSEDQLDDFLTKSLGKS